MATAAACPRVRVARWLSRCAHGVGNTAWPWTAVGVTAAVTASTSASSVPRCTGLPETPPPGEWRGSIVIPRPDEFQRKRRAMIDGGLESLAVIADFDRTITSVADGALSLEIRKAKQKLFDYYYPIEKSADLTAEQKQPLMIEWYSKSNTALIDGKFRRSQLESAVTAARQGRGGSGNEGLALRNGYVEFQAACEAAQVPLLIFSAGIADVIQAIFSQFHVQLGPTTRLVSNWMVWNELETTDDAQLVGFTKPLIHMYNKNQSVVPQTERRRHVLLLGDGLGDVAMADGAPIAPTEVLKVGFLNENTQALRKKYEAVYDVLILHDGDFEVPNLLLKEVAEGGDLGRIANVGNGLWRVVEPKL